MYNCNHIYLHFTHVRRNLAKYKAFAFIGSHNLCIYEITISDVPLVFYKTKYGMVLCAIGNEESADTDSGEKVRMATSMLVADFVDSLFW